MTQLIRKAFDRIQHTEQYIEKRLTYISPSLLLFLAVMVFGIVTHGYAFFHEAFTHDSLNALYADPAEDAWKISLGRFLKPVYETIVRGDLAVPWLIGILTLLWLGLACYLVVEMFEIKSRISLILTCGIMITNLTVTLTAAAYIHDLDSNMFALLLAVSAAYRWKKNTTIDWISILCIALSMGIYQAYVSVSIMLMLIGCMMGFLEEKKLLHVVFKGLSACITLLLGALVYAVLLWFIQNISNVSMDTGSYNGLQGIKGLSIKDLIRNVSLSYTYIREDLFYSWNCIFPVWLFKAMHLMLAGCAVLNTIFLLFGMKSSSRIGILFSTILLACIPVAVYFSAILSTEPVRHHLTLYALWFVYILVLLIINHEPTGIHKIAFSRILRLASVVVLSILICGNIRAANSIYLVKDFQSKAAASFMTRILYRMEDSEEYITGKTSVAFIGHSSLLSDNIPGADRYSRLTGVPVNLLKRDPNNAYDPIFKLVLNKLDNPVNICDNNTYLKLSGMKEVAEMPCYPHKDCMKLIDGVFVVKLGN